MKISFQNLCTIGALEDLYELKKKKIKEIQRLKMFLVLFICILHSLVKFIPGRFIPIAFFDLCVYVYMCGANELVNY